VPYYGPEDAKIILIGAYPGEEEMETGFPLVGPAGQLLRKEALKSGFDITEFRVGNLWLHRKTENTECFQFGFKWALSEAKNKAIVILMGAQPVSAFTTYSVLDVNGLWVKSDYFSVPHILASISPAQALRTGLGELHFMFKQLHQGLLAAPRGVLSAATSL